MANIIRVPVTVNLPWYSFTMTLDNVGYQLEMAYLSRADRWSLTIADLTGAAIARNIPVRIDLDLLSIYRAQAVPPGSLFCVDTTGKQNQPTLGSFLTTHAMYYAQRGV